ncbi:MAG TPA: FtsX-like permease family protein [Bacteroidota bacterium]|nr:FtsX-like permease family protein [Bacteroidota bacterium]
MKLRTTLTVTGIVIAIAAFVSMVSFGAGMKLNVDKQFEQLGLLSTISVYTERDRRGREAEQVPANSPRLDVAAMDRIAKIPNVLLVFPYDAFDIKARIGDSTFDSKAQALSHNAMQSKLFSRMKAGAIFPNDSARTALLTDELLKKSGFKSVDSLIGKRLIVSVQVATFDSALAHLLNDQGVSVMDQLKNIHADSLLHSPSYRDNVLRAEANEAVRRLITGFMNHRATISDTLTICGVIEGEEGMRLRAGPVIIPFKTGKKFSSSGMSTNPTDLFTAMSAGNLIPSPGTGSDRYFSQLTVNFDPHAYYKPIKDSIEAMGFRAFSFAEQFAEIQKAFVYLDLALGAIGLLALLTASLGIVNTMVMSILERRKEIGIFKSLGAHEGEIRALFLVESGAIGFLGAVLGIAAGWVITKIATVIAHAYMRQQGIPEIQLFALPWWLVLIALAVGTGVALVAGLYPASRAARVDPVEALRGD